MTTFFITTLSTLLVMQHMLENTDKILLPPGRSPHEERSGEPQKDTGRLRLQNTRIAIEDQGVAAMAGNPPSTCVNPGESGAFPADRQHRVSPLFISFRGQQTAVPLPIANGGHTPIDMNIIVGNKRRVSSGSSGNNQTDGYSSITRFIAEAGQGQNSIGNDEAAVGTAELKISTFLPAPNPGTIAIVPRRRLSPWSSEVLTMSPTYTFEMISGNQASVFDSFTDELRLLALSDQHPAFANAAWAQTHAKSPTYDLHGLAPRASRHHLRIGLFISEIRCQSSSQERNKVGLTRAPHAYPSPNSHGRSRPIGAVLSLLCVNKYTYYDAIGVFYSINHFHCWDTANLSRFVQGISPSTGKLPKALQIDRRQFIKRLSFDFRCGQRFYNTQTFNANAKHCPGLTHLGVYINEDHWDAQTYQGVALYPIPTSYPGILAFYRVLKSQYLKEINLEGTCNKMKRLLRRPPLALSQLPEGKFWPPESLKLKIKHASGATEEHVGLGNRRLTTHEPAFSQIMCAREKIVSFVDGLRKAVK
ncbi:hypothetical protein KC359_g243 [Hortaea werneckii]|nr:hypothetical protein KC359_g243 [Hortaea werneckii]